LDRTVAGGERLSIHKLPDPTDETVTAELINQGFNSTDAGRIIEACGRRLLETPLKQGAAGTDVDPFLQKSILFYSFKLGYTLTRFGERAACFKLRTAVLPAARSCRLLALAAACCS
jgi:hypothetical protein